MNGYNCHTCVKAFLNDMPNTQKRILERTKDSPCKDHRNTHCCHDCYYEAKLDVYESEHTPCEKHASFNQKFQNEFPKGRAE